MDTAVYTNWKEKGENHGGLELQTDLECMEILQIARNTFYKYKRELLAETEDAGSTVE